MKLCLILAAVLSATSVALSVSADDPRLVFRLGLATITEDGREATAETVLDGTDGRVAVVSPGWICGWYRSLSHGDQALTVECFSGGQDRMGVSTAVFCSDVVPSRQTGGMMVTTIDDRGVPRRTRFTLFCQSR